MKKTPNPVNNFVEEFSRSGRDARPARFLLVLPQSCE